MTGRGASQYGLTSTKGEDWRVQAACKNEDPAMWEITKESAEENLKALRICRHQCPVRTQCRDDMLGLIPAARSIIAGGWCWNAEGRPTPVRGEENLMPARADPPAELPTPGRSRRAAGVDVERYLAAGQALAATRAVRPLCREYGLSVRRVYAAGMVVRWASDLLVLIAAGAVSIADAEDLARARRDHAWVERRTVGEVSGG